MEPTYALPPSIQRPERRQARTTNDSAPSEARKRGSGGGSPRKYNDLLTGPSDLDAQPRHLRSCTSDSAPSKARKRGSGGGSPRKYDDLLSGRLRRILGAVRDTPIAVLHVESAILSLQERCLTSAVLYQPYQSACLCDHAGSSDPHSNQPRGGLSTGSN
jgi:hypothetical protein